MQGKKAIEIKDADVAELVDARDLKSPGATEITHLSDLTRAGNPHEAGGDPAVLSNTPPPVCTENPKFDHSGDEVRPGRRVN